MYSTCIDGDGDWWKIILATDFLDFKAMDGSKEVRGGKGQPNDDISCDYCSKVKDDNHLNERCNFCKKTM